jgi:Leucine-rich repeat (LRR) protein
MRIIALALVISAGCFAANVAALGGKTKTDAQGRIVALNLHSSWINDSDLLEIARLPQLADLDLSETRITDIGFQQLKDLKNVSSLNLYYAEQIGDGTLAAVREWKQLRRLNLRGTKVTDAGLVHLAGLPIESLDVGFSLFTDNGFENLVNLPQLTHLAVGGNKVTDTGLNSLRLMPNLVELDLSGAQRTDSGLWAASITDRSIETLNSLTRLESLNLRGAKFSDEGFARLGRAKGLRELNLGETQLSAKGLSGLSNFPKLETLSLYKAERVGDDAVPVLAALKTLRWLDITGTTITASGVQTLKAANPGCTILWDEAAVRETATKKSR